MIISTLITLATLDSFPGSTPPALSPSSSSCCSLCASPEHAIQGSMILNCFSRPLPARLVQCDVASQNIKPFRLFRMGSSMRFLFLVTGLRFRAGREQHWSLLTAVVPRSRHATLDPDSLPRTEQGVNQLEWAPYPILTVSA